MMEGRKERETERKGKRGRRNSRSNIAKSGGTTAR
jgi:hypothetical protein